MPELKARGARTALDFQRILHPKAPCPGLSRASTSCDSDNLRTEDVDGRTKS